MEDFWGSLKLMLVVYALAAVISFLVAWIIRLIYAGIKRQEARAGARNNAPPRRPPESGSPAARRKA